MKTTPLALMLLALMATTSLAQTTINYAYDQNGNRIQRTTSPHPDLIPILYARPSTLYGTSPITILLDVIEVGGTPSAGLITLRLTRSSRISLSFDPTATSLGGRAVQNSLWSLDNSNSSVYILTTTQSILARNKLSVGLSGTLTPGATSGSLTLSTLIVAGSGGELVIINNADAEKIDYFQQ